MTIERRKVRVFGVTMYFAICHECQGWIKSSVGQFCWTQRARRNHVVNAHREQHQP